MLCCGGARGGARVAALLLLHANLLLVLFSGGGLAMAARLKWDPSAYVPLRELAPLEYRVTCALLLVGSLALMLLAHAAAAAVSAGAHSAVRRPILYTYASVMSLLVLAELSAVAWAVWRVLSWLDSEQAQDLMQLLEARDHLRATLQILAKWLPMPEKIKQLLEEVEADLPRNGYAAAGAAITLLLLQPTAAALALAAARPAAPPRAPAPRASASTLASTTSASTFSRAGHRRARQKNHSEASTVSEKAPLKTAYRNGRLVII